MKLRLQVSRVSSLPHAQRYWCGSTCVPCLVLNLSFMSQSEVKWMWEGTFHSFGESLLRQQSWNTLATNYLKHYKNTAAHGDLFSCSACTFSLLQQCSLKNTNLRKPECFTGIYWFCPNLQIKRVRKMGQLALSPSPVSCVSSHPRFPGDSSPLCLSGEVLMLPCPTAPSQADCCGGRRHQHGPCLSSCALLSTRTSGQGTATYMGWLSFSPGLLGFLVFSPANGINKGKDAGLLCWTPYSWLWNNKMQCNSVFFWLIFFLF